MTHKNLLACYLCSLMLIGTTVPLNAQMFEEVAVPSGISYTGQSWGASWGDFNGDGWPDLWAPNHGRKPFLMINQQDGTFVDIAEQVMPLDIWLAYSGNGTVYDQHGAVWIDIDRDGDQDIFQAADGGVRLQPDHLYINHSGASFSEVGASVGAAGVGNNSTMPLPADFNNDGLPDIVIPGAQGLATAERLRFLQQIPGSAMQFNDVTSLIAPPGISSNLHSATVTDLDGDRLLEVGFGDSPIGLQVIEHDSGQYNDTTQVLGLEPFNIRSDVAIADFDGDLDDDIYMVRGEPDVEVVQVADNVIEAAIAVRSDERGFSFVTAGDITVELHPTFQVNAQDIYVGASGYQPGGTNFTLDATDPANVGIMPHTPGALRGYFVGLDPATDTWTFKMTSNGFLNHNIVITTVEQISDVILVDVELSALTPRADYYLENDNGVFQNQALAAGFVIPSAGRNIAKGDFDNDGDIDLYVVATGPAQNRPNLLYLNQGNGSFVAEPAHGAEGGSQGRGDAVAVADYDQDGSLDFFVTNGKSKPPFDADGVYALYHNLGNTNHWLQIDLRGTDSSPSGIGAAVHVTSAGTTQRRLADAGVHYRAQNHQRLHFGLGSATLVDTIEITWASGTVQTLNNIAADQILKVVEPSINDTDSDGIINTLDNCQLVANPGQVDADGDGYGNFCDADINNDGITNFGDLSILATLFLSDDPIADLNADGIVNFADVAIFSTLFLMPPGPSGLN